MNCGEGQDMIDHPSYVHNLLVVVELKTEKNSGGLIAQLVDHCTGIAEVMGSNPIQAWIFFRL